MAHSICQKNLNIPFHPDTSKTESWYSLRFPIVIPKDVFDKVDLLHAPVVPIPVPTIAESDIQANPGFIEFLLNLGHCTRPFDYLGLPAVSVPAGKTDNGLPTGFQLVAPPLDEAILFKAARAYEKEKPWNYQNIISGWINLKVVLFLAILFFTKRKIRFMTFFRKKKII